MLNLLFVKLYFFLGKDRLTAFQSYIKTNGIELVHFPYQFIIEDLQVPSVTTIHDVQELIYPEFFTSHERLERAKINKRAIDGANRVIVSYMQIKDDVNKFFAKKLSSIDVHCIDMNVSWIKKYSVSDVDENSPLPQKYIVQAASTWAHKNHIGLLRAILYLREERNLKVNLVVTGNKTRFYSEIEHFIKENELEDQVSFLGLVEEKELYRIYQNSIGLVVPNVYEAGSIPMCECINLKLPVVCSDIPTLSEVVEDKRFMFDPTDIADIANKIELLCTNDLYRDNCVENSNKILGRMNLNDIAIGIQKTYASALEGAYASEF